MGTRGCNRHSARLRAGLGTGPQHAGTPPCASRSFHHRNHCRDAVTHPQTLLAKSLRRGGRAPGLECAHPPRSSGRRSRLHAPEGHVTQHSIPGCGLWGCVCGPAKPRRCPGLQERSFGRPVHARGQRERRTRTGPTCQRVVPPFSSTASSRGASARRCFGSLTTLCYSFSDSTPSSPLFLKSWDDPGTPPKVFLMVLEPPDVALGSPGNDLIILVTSTPPECPPSSKPSPMVKSEHKHVVGQLLDVSRGLLCPPPTPTQACHTHPPPALLTGTVNAEAAVCTAAGRVPGQRHLFFLRVL